MLFTDVSCERAIRAFERAGFRILRRGKHVVLGNGSDLIVLPRTKRLNPYTLRKIIRDAEISDEAFAALLK